MYTYVYMYPRVCVHVYHVYMLVYAYTRICIVLLCMCV